MELTFSCKNCGTVGHVSPLKASHEAACRHCGTAKPIDREGCTGGELDVLPALRDA